MNLAQYQRSFVAACLDAEPSADTLAALGGDAQRWGVYRHMVRARLWKMATVAFSRTLAACGKRRFEASHDRFLEARGPRSRFIREVICAFGRFALEDAEFALSVLERDVLRFELLKWELSYLPHDAPPSALVDFDFDAAPVLNPLLRVARFDHAVTAADGVPEATATQLLVYRRPRENKVQYWSVDGFGAAFFEQLSRPGAVVADAVRSAAEQSALPLDPALLERLSTLLALAVERGVLLGSVAR